MDPREIRRRLLENLQGVRGRIERRRPQGGPEVKLVVVTKQVGPQMVQALFELGEREFGESRVSDALTKAQLLRLEGARWHMIGHLQRNKAAKVFGLFYMVHSVDSLELAEILARRAEEEKAPLEVLIQVNTTDEPQKRGVRPDQARSMVEHVSALKSLRVRGLMTMARLSGDAEEARPAFRLLSEIFSAVRNQGLVGPEFSELSMGMSQDYAVAVEEGATIVRVGSAIFEGLK